MCFCEDVTFPGSVLYCPPRRGLQWGGSGLKVRVKVGGAWVSEADGRTDGGLDIEWINKTGGCFLFRKPENDLFKQILSCRTFLFMRSLKKRLNKEDTLFQHGAGDD